jgi:uncharacterized protein (DUF433 family)
MAMPTDIKYIVIDPEVLGGRPSIAGHRIGVIHIATWIQQEMTPGEIAEMYGLALAEIHAALAYYYDHRDAIDQQAAEDDARLAAYAASDTSPLAQRIRARFEERQARYSCGGGGLSAPRSSVHS